MRLIGWDTETHPIQDGLKAPPIVCVQLKLDTHPAQIFVGADRKVKTQEVFESARDNPEVFLLGQNVCFDAACTIANWPDLTTLVFDVFEAGKIWDVRIRDKMLQLALTGNIRSDDGGSVGYGLDDIALRRIGIEVRKDDPWRLRYAELEHVPLAEWPPEPIRYAEGDVDVLLPIYEEQDRLAERAPIEPASALWRAHALNACASLALYLMSCVGVAIDPEERERVEAMLGRELAPEKLEPLHLSGILRRAQPPRPHKNGSGKMTKGEPASRDMKLLKQIVEETCTKYGIPITLTDGGKTGNKQVSTSAEVLEEIAHFDPRLEEYQRFMTLQKLVTTEMPRIRKPRVHPNYDELVNTGRTSSYDPNVQNVDPRARGCYVPDPGWVFCSTDYSSLELVTLAQKLLDLFGKSHLADLIREGVDPHAYLGAQMAQSFAPQEFRQLTGFVGGSPRETYEAFIALKKFEPGTPQRDFFAHWRKFAKPVGLGYPGGLGPRTLVTLAASPIYGIRISVDDAAAAKEVWFEAFPEMRDYFNWITGSQQYIEDGEEYYWYLSPNGMLRAKATYCAAANGAALQTPAAEGAKFAMWELARACFDPSKRSILYGCRPWGFIHDEFLVSLPDDSWLHERAHEVAAIMVRGMQRVIRDVPVKAEPALMRRWDKRAEKVLGPDGRIRVWEPLAA